MRKAIIIAGALAALAAAAVAIIPERVAGVLPAPLAQMIAGTEEGAGDGAQRKRRAVPVALTAPRRGVAETRFETSGSVVAAEEVVLSSEISGLVETVHAEDGARLAKGDPVLRFEDDAVQAELEAAQRRAEEMRAELSRQSELLDRGVVAEARVEEARAAAETAEARLEAARTALDDLTVRAPFAGRIGFVRVSPGAWLAPGDPIADLRATDDIRVRFDLPLEVAEAAADAQEVTLTGAEDCGRAEIVAVSPLGDAATRTREFEARLPEDCGLAPGGFVAVSVVTARREGALFVPQSAVLREGFEAAVFRVEESEGGLVARRTPVELGAFKGDMIEVREGLAADDRIVASGLQKVSDGVRVVEAQDGAAGSQPETGRGANEAPSEGGAAAAKPGDAGRGAVQEGGGEASGDASR